jgi:hypothetical protein
VEIERNGILVEVEKIVDHYVMLIWEVEDEEITNDYCYLHGL